MAILIRKYALLAFCLLIGLSACTQSGDPTSGGLFWSQAKNEERIRDVEQRLESSLQKQHREREKNIEKMSLRDEQFESLESSKARIKKLQEERVRLQDRLNTLAVEKKISDTKLKSLLGKHYKLMPPHAVPMLSMPGTESHRTRLASQLQSENQDYLEAILILVDY